MDIHDVRNELQVIDKLYRPGVRNIVAVFGHGEIQAGSLFYLDMELCELDLATFLQNKWTSTAWERGPRIQLQSLGPSDEVTQVRQILTDIVTGIAYIHSQNQVHRDLKPQNGGP